jgi:hypothetical protein
MKRVQELLLDMTTRAEQLLIYKKALEVISAHYPKAICSEFEDFLYSKKLRLDDPTLSYDDLSVKIDRSKDIWVISELTLPDVEAKLYIEPLRIAKIVSNWETGKPIVTAQILPRTNLFSLNNYREVAWETIQRRLVEIFMEENLAQVKPIQILSDPDLSTVFTFEVAPILFSYMESRMFL